MLTAPDHSNLKNYRSENQDREVASTKQFPETHKLKYYIFRKTFLKNTCPHDLYHCLSCLPHTSVYKDINLDSELFNTCDSMFTLTDKSRTTSETDWSSGPLPGRTKKSSPSAALSPPVWAGFRGGRGPPCWAFCPAVESTYTRTYGQEDRLRNLPYSREVAGNGEINEFCPHVKVLRE